MTLASRVTGLVRDLFMASMFGANALTDAFNVAFRIPNLFRRLFAEGAFSQAFVPVLAASHAKEGPERTHQLISNVATVLVWVLLVVCVLGVVGAPVLVWLLASGFQNQGEAQAAVLMPRWMFPYIGFMSLVALSSGVLNTYKHFAVPAATPVLLNLCMIGAAWLLTFTLSLDDVVLSSFLSGPGSTTMPIAIFSRARLGLNPSVNTVATLTVAVVSVGILIASIMMARAQRRRQADVAASYRGGRTAKHTGR